MSENFENNITEYQNINILGPSSGPEIFSHEEPHSPSVSEFEKSVVPNNEQENLPADIEPSGPNNEDEGLELSKAQQKILEYSQNPDLELIPHEKRTLETWINPTTQEMFGIDEKGNEINYTALKKQAGGTDYEKHQKEITELLSNNFYESRDTLTTINIQSVEAEENYELTEGITTETSFITIKSTRFENEQKLIVESTCFRSEKVKPEEEEKQRAKTARPTEALSPTHPAAEEESLASEFVFSESIVINLDEELLAESFTSAATEDAQDEAISGYEFNLRELFSENRTLDNSEIPEASSGSLISYTANPETASLSFTNHEPAARVSEHGLLHIDTTPQYEQSEPADAHVEKLETNIYPESVITIVERNIIQSPLTPPEQKPVSVRIEPFIEHSADTTSFTGVKNNQKAAPAPSPAIAQSTPTFEHSPLTYQHIQVTEEGNSTDHAPIAEAILQRTKDIERTSHTPEQKVYEDNTQPAIVAAQRTQINTQPQKLHESPKNELQNSFIRVVSELDKVTAPEQTTNNLKAAAQNFSFKKPISFKRQLSASLQIQTQKSEHTTPPQRNPGTERDPVVATKEIPQTTGETEIKAAAVPDSLFQTAAENAITSNTAISVAKETRTPTQPASSFIPHTVRAIPSHNTPALRGDLRNTRFITPKPETEQLRRQEATPLPIKTEAQQPARQEPGLPRHSETEKDSLRPTEIANSVHRVVSAPSRTTLAPGVIIRFSKSLEDVLPSHNTRQPSAIPQTRSIHTPSTIPLLSTRFKKEAGNSTAYATTAGIDDTDTGNELATNATRQQQVA